MGVGMQGIGLESGRVFEQAIQNIDRFPDPAGNEVAEQGDIRVANMRVGDAALYHIIRWSVEKEMGNHGKSPSYRWSNEGILPGLSGCRNSRTLEGHDPTGRIWTV